MSSAKNKTPRKLIKFPFTAITEFMNQYSIFNVFP